MKILTCVDSIHNLTEKMRYNDKVFYMRFGDNDIMQMVGKDLQGGRIRKPLGNNLSVWSPEMQEDITNSFQIKHPNYMKSVTVEWPKEPGMNGNVFGKKKHPILSHYVSTLTTEKVFYQPVVFHYLASFRPDLLKVWLKEVKGMKKTFIGRANNPEKLFGDFAYKIKTPEKNSYYSIDELLPKIKKAASNSDIVIGCAGQLTRALGHHLWSMDEDFHFIDFGSLIELCDGRKTRQWLKYKGEEIIKNFKL